METLKADHRIANYALQAKDTGVARDQLENFLRAGYFAFPTILPFHAAARLADRPDGPDQIGLGGTRYFGKTHSVMAQVGLDDCQRVPGLKVLFLRKIMKSAGESLEDLVYQVFRYQPHTFTEGQVEFPNSSRILVGGYNNESDIDKYLGINYDVLVLEEATQLTAGKKDRIYGSIRTSIPGWKARKYLTTNPDGVGLQWFKLLFVTPWRQGRESDTRFFNCHWRDNPLAKPEYIKYLLSLKGPLAAAWRDGDWDAFAGQIFPEWSYDRHVIQPFELPPSWPRWRALDYGYIHPYVCYWFAKQPATGRIFVYRELSAQLLSDREQARAIQEATPPDERIPITYASPDMWAREADEETGKVTSPADHYRREKLLLTKADDGRINGVRKLHYALADLADGKPGLQVFSTCYRLIETMPTLISNPLKPEDVLKVDADPTTGEGGDDAYDALRYGLTNAKLDPAPVQKPQPTRTVASIRHL